RAINVDALIIEPTAPVGDEERGGGPCVNDSGALVGIASGEDGKAAAVGIFIERGECEKFINRVFAESAALNDKNWQRPKRRLLSRRDNPAKERATYVEQLHSPDEEIRYKGALRLAVLGPDAHAALPDLAKALGDENPLVRLAVMRALREIGQPT